MSDANVVGDSSESAAAAWTPGAYSALFSDADERVEVESLPEPTQPLESMPEPEPEPEPDFAPARAYEPVVEAVPEVEPEPQPVPEPVALPVPPAPVAAAAAVVDDADKVGIVDKGEPALAPAVPPAAPATPPTAKPEEVAAPSAKPEPVVPPPARVKPPTVKPEVAVPPPARVMPPPVVREAVAPTFVPPDLRPEPIAPPPLLRPPPPKVAPVEQAPPPPLRPVRRPLQPAPVPQPAAAPQTLPPPVRPARGPVLPQAAPPAAGASAIAPRIAVAPLPNVAPALLPIVPPPTAASTGSRLEVVNKEGWRKEYLLQRTLIYAGSQPGSDVYLPAPEVAPRHIQFVPSPVNRAGYRLINFSAAPLALRESGGAARLVPPRGTAELSDGDAVELAGYSMVFHSGAMQSASIQARVELASTRLELDRQIEGTLYIRNSGDKAGVQFEIQTQGFDQRFVQVDSGPVLFPGVEKSIAFRIAHPRQPTPPAGDHTLTLVVTAPGVYPGESAMVSATFTVAPFFAHSIRFISVAPSMEGYTLR